MKDERVFVAHAGGAIDVLDITAGMQQALDIMLADRVPAERAAGLVAAAAKSGQDPVAFAEHFVELRRAFRGES